MATYHFGNVQPAPNEPVDGSAEFPFPYSYLEQLPNNEGINPGDQILFRRGETFTLGTNSLVIAASGTAGYRITYGAYGTGAKPVISGLLQVTNWTPTPNRPGVYESVVPNVAAGLNNLIIDGRTRELGRYPDRYGVNGGWENYKSAHNDANPPDYNHGAIFSAVTSSPLFIGAEIVIRKRISVFDRHLIANHTVGSTGSAITYERAGESYMPYTDQPGYGYFFQNHIDTLSSFGEWFYNSATSMLYVYFGSFTPSNHTVHVSTLEHIVISTNKSYVTFDNIVFQGANGHCLNINGGDHIEVKNGCEIKFNGADGIHAFAHPFLLVENCYIDYNTNTAIHLGYDDSHNAIIRWNTIDHTGELAGQGRNGDGNQFAIFGTGHSNLIEFNKIYNTGYTGIYIRGNNAIQRNNLVHTFCTIKNDGGAFYAYSEDVAHTYTGMQILNSIAVNGVFSGYGTPGNTRWSMGVYLDGIARNIEVRGVTVIGCAGMSLFCNTISNCTIEENTFYGSDEQMRLTRHTLDENIVNNTIRYNKFICNNANQLTASFNSPANDINSFGTIDYNYYVNPFAALHIHKALVETPPSLIDLIANRIDLARWKTATVPPGHDTNSMESPVTLQPYIINSVIGTNKFANGTFDSGTGTLYAWAAPNNITLEWAPGMIDGFALVTFSNPPAAARHESLLNQNIGAVTNGTKYKINFLLEGNANDISLSVYLRQANGPTWHTISDEKFVKITTALTNYEVVLSCIETQSEVALVFRLFDQNISFGIDNVSCYEVDAALPNPNDHFLVEYNDVENNKTVNLGADTYKDATGQVYSGSVTIEPWKSIVLIKVP